MKKPVFTRLMGTFRIGHRLLMAFSILIALMVLMAAIGAWQIVTLSDVTTRIATVDTRAQRLVSDWYADTASNAVRSLIYARTDDPELLRLLAPEIESGTRRNREQRATVERQLETEEIRALYNKVNAARKVYTDSRDAVLENRKAGKEREANALLESKLVPAIAGYLGSIHAMVRHYDQKLEQSATFAAATAKSGREILFGVCLAGSLLGVLFSWLISVSITRPIRQAVVAARRVAEGDLTIQVQPGGTDETGQLLHALSAMANNLRTLVGAVAGGAHTVADTSAQIAQGNLDLSQRTEEQAATLEETASSMEELTSKVTLNAHTARQASQLAVGASDVARRGGNVVGQVVSTMNGISESSRKIGDIIGVIDGIAFQTNILALNAAVEAARAGDHGRGFAVVASEVRSLAQRSATAAKEIKALIGDSVSQVEAGTQLVDAAGRTMDEIVGSVRQVSDLIAEIAASSQDQSAGIEQVNRAITQMDQVVQQNASLVEQATAATESMKDQAGALLGLVAQFSLAVPQVSVQPAPRNAVVTPRRRLLGAQVPAVFDL
jgi:methyl-accepting chemotaxis protein